MGIEDGSTLRWTKARERNRLKARYLIRSSVISRVVADDVVVDDDADAGAASSANAAAAEDVDGALARRTRMHAAADDMNGNDVTLSSSSSSTITTTENANSNCSRRRCHLNHEDSNKLPTSTCFLNNNQNDDIHTNELKILRHYLERIIQNHVSSFSVAALAKHGHILERLPVLLLLHPTATAFAADADDDSASNATATTTTTSSYTTNNTAPFGTTTNNDHHNLITEMMSTIPPWTMNDAQQRKQCPPQPTTLAASKFGRDYVTKRLVPYMQRIQKQRSSSSSSSRRRRTLTILEYASLLGRHDIVSMLLLGGVDPTFLPSSGDGDEDNGNEEGGGSRIVSSSTKEATRSVLARLHNVPLGKHNGRAGLDDHEEDGAAEGSSVIPLSMWAYMVRAVIDMRMNGILDAGSNQQEEGDLLCKNGYYCNLCNTHHRNIPPLLKFGPPCYHNYCESCMWKHLVKHVPQCTNLKRKVVTCPVCEEEFRGMNILCNDEEQRHNAGVRTEKIVALNEILPEEKKDDGDNLLSIKELSLQDEEQSCQRHCQREQQLMRCNKSLSKFLKLPATCTELKQLSNKAKKTIKKRRDYAHGTWEDALHATMSTMQSQSVRSDRFFKAVLSSPQRVAAYLEAGVNVNMQNMYGQTCLYLACWKGSVSGVRSLLDYGANVDIAANGGSTCYSIANKCRRIEVMHLLEENARRIMHDSPSPTSRGTDLPTMDLSSLSITNGKCHVSILIDPAEDHPGAGACIVDDALSDEQLQRLEDLWKSLPVSEAPSEEAINEKNIVVSSTNTAIQLGNSESGIGDNNKSAYRPSRYYYCDAEEWVQTMLAGCVDAARMALLATMKTTCSEALNCTDTTSNGVRRPLPPTSIFQHIRFLNYERPGGILPPHVDLCRVDSASGFRSTHTFILYLTDCGQQGGGTALLQQLNDPKVISVVQPKRGRALIFPHMCPHSGLEVVRAPKLLLRGEIIMDLDTHANFISV